MGVPCPCAGAEALAQASEVKRRRVGVWEYGNVSDSKFLELLKKWQENYYWKRQA
jgi:hypothetical protein